jgi:hypothetical protein
MDCDTLYLISPTVEAADQTLLLPLWSKKRDKQWNQLLENKTQVSTESNKTDISKKLSSPSPSVTLSVAFQHAGQPLTPIHRKITRFVKYPYPFTVYKIFYRYSVGSS